MNIRLRDSLKRAWYRLARLMVGTLLYSVFRLTVEGLENLPLEGPLILASNHKSYMDPPAVGVACPRRVHFMGKKSLFEFLPMRLLFTSLGAFPVEREKVDRGALATALGLLEDGRVLGIFPEGTRSKGGLGDGQEGTAWLSLKAGCPVVPVAVIGAEGTTPAGIISLARRKLTVRFGEPIWPSRTGPGAGHGRTPGATPATMPRRRELVTAEVMKGIGDLLGGESRKEGSGHG